MKSKTIRKLLAGKFSEFAASIEDEELRGLVEKHTIITGGCIVSMLLKEKVNDYDLYFTNRETALRVANYYVEKFRAAAVQKHGNGHDIGITVQEKTDRIHIKIQSAGIASEKGTQSYEYFEAKPEDQASAHVEKTMEAKEGKEEDTDYRPIFLSSNAIMLSGGVQVIVRFYGEPEEIHSTYDFVHCTNYWRSDSDELHLNQKALEAILARELLYVGSKYPLCSIIRTRKFIQRGWSINAGQYLKMCLQLGELDLRVFDVLEDQLIGVDTAYFNQILALVKDLEPEKMNAAYLCAIIDRIF